MTLLEDAELFKHVIPLEMLEKLPLPLLRRLRELQKKRREARQKQMSVNSSGIATAVARNQQIMQNQHLNFDPTALGEMLMDEI